MFLFFVLIITTVLAVQTDVTPELQILNANSAFANDYYRVVASKDEGNILISPLSAHACLSMLYQGTSGTTRDACAKVLKIPEPSLAAEGYKTILDNFNNNILENVTLNIANKAYVNNELELKSNFKNTVSEYFKSEVESIDFIKNEAAAATINDWVKEKTKGKISSICEKDSLNADTLLVLINAVYFKGRWGEEFPKSFTKTENFYFDGESKVDVQMMHKRSVILYKESTDLAATIIELPFTDDSFSMIFLLPNQKNGLKDVENKLVTKEVSNILDGSTVQVVDVALPKFSFSQIVKLTDVLKELGLEILFDNACDLSEMSARWSRVSKALQNTFIRVDEEGCEAAAVTGLQATDDSLLITDDWKTFVADHPFIFLLSHKPSNTNLRNILFYGRVTKPITLS